jgi:hypothetical protein
LRAERCEREEEVQPKRELEKGEKGRGRTAGRDVSPVGEEEREGVPVLGGVVVRDDVLDACLPDGKWNKKSVLVQEKGGRKRRTFDNQVIPRL